MGGQRGNKNAVGHGAPKGNQNAFGHGAPKGNQNARKHGGYTAPSVLTEEEEDILFSSSEDLEVNLIEQIRIYKIREFRLMKAIQHYSSLQDDDGNCGFDVMILDNSTSTTDSREFDNADDEQAYNNEIHARVERGERLPGDKCVVRETRVNVINYIIRLEQELTTVQRACVDTVIKLNEYRDMHGDTLKTAADDWVGLIDEIEQE